MNRISTEVDTVQDVSDYDKTRFDGFPAVTVVTSGNENDFYTTAENQRVFGFDINVYVSMGKTAHTVDDNAYQSAERVMGNAVSDIIDAFDTFITFGGDADFLRASPSVWDYVESSEGFMRHAVIKLEVVKSFNI